MAVVDARPSGDFKAYATDGSIWVTIDDNESHYLKVLMDEVLDGKIRCQCAMAIREPWQ